MARHPYRRRDARGLRHFLYSAVLAAAVIGGVTAVATTSSMARKRIIDAPFSVRLLQLPSHTAMRTDSYRRIQWSATTKSNSSHSLQSPQLRQRKLHGPPCCHPSCAQPGSEMGMPSDSTITVSCSTPE